MTSTLYPTLQSTPVHFNLYLKLAQCQKKNEFSLNRSVSQKGQFDFIAVPLKELIVHVASSQPATENV